MSPDFSVTTTLAACSAGMSTVAGLSPALTVTFFSKPPEPSTTNSASVLASSPLVRVTVTPSQEEAREASGFAVGVSGWEHVPRNLTKPLRCSYSVHSSLHLTWTSSLATLLSPGTRCTPLSGSLLVCGKAGSASSGVWTMPSTGAGDASTRRKRYFSAPGWLPLSVVTSQSTTHSPVAVSHHGAPLTSLP